LLTSRTTLDHPRLQISYRRQEIRTLQTKRRSTPWSSHFFGAMGLIHFRLELSFSPGQADCMSNVRWTLLLVFCFVLSLTIVGPSIHADSPSQLNFIYLHRVAMTSRCMNCHSPTNSPFVGDQRTPHPMLISRKIKTLGYSCQTCHASQGESFYPAPPKAIGWDMPDSKKALRPGLSAKELCLLWKNPAKNFFETGPRTGQGRSLTDLMEHVTNDHLVHWAFEPGAGRTGAPGTHAEFVRVFRNWLDTGAECPD
jgi:hypothetical protein